MNLPYSPLGALHSALAGIREIGATEADGGCSVQQLRAWLIARPSVVLEERGVETEAIAQQLQTDKMAVLVLRGDDMAARRISGTARVQLLGLGGIYLSRLDLLADVRSSTPTSVAASRSKLMGGCAPLPLGPAPTRPGALDAASIPSRTGNELRPYQPSTGLGVA
jgi:hypothetical protein